MMTEPNDETLRLSDLTTENKTNERYKPSPMAGKGDAKRSRNWVFTWNHYIPDDIVWIRDKWLELFELTCAMWGEEVAPKTGTPHLQGFMVFKNLKTFKQVKAMVPGLLHLEMMIKDIGASITYCSKDGKSEHIGDLPMTQKQKGKMGGSAASMMDSNGSYGPAAMNTWQAFQRDVEAGMDRKALARKYPHIYGDKNKGFEATYELLKPKPVFDLTKRFDTLFAWQRELLELIAKGANERDVHWIWSVEGAVGKSDMVKHLVSCNGFQPMQNAPTRDLACAWKQGDVAFDYSRDQEGSINYSMIENLKNRLVFSPKYESMTKASDDFKPIFVVCFSNSLPDVTKLSSDRWNIYRINDDDTRTWTRQEVRSGIVRDAQV